MSDKLAPDEFDALLREGMDWLTDNAPPCLERTHILGCLNWMRNHPDLVYSTYPEPEGKST